MDPKIIMYINHALINALSAHMIYIKLKINTIFYTYVEDTHTTARARAHTHTHTHTL